MRARTRHMLIAATLMGLALTPARAQQLTPPNIPLTFGMTIFKPSANGTTRIATTVKVRDFVDLLIGRLASPPRSR